MYHDKPDYYKLMRKAQNSIRKFYANRIKSLESQSSASLDLRESEILSKMTEYAEISIELLANSRCQDPLESYNASIHIDDLYERKALTLYDYSYENSDLYQTTLFCNLFYIDDHLPELYFKYIANKRR